MSGIEIYSGPLSMFGAKAEMAAIEKGIHWKRVFVPFSLRSLYEPKSAVVCRVNPKQQVPVLIDGDLGIFDSTQIFEFLEDVYPSPPLWPTDARDRAQARRMELSSDEVFFPEVVHCMPHNRSRIGEQAYQLPVEKIHQYFDQMNQVLAEREYLASGFGFADLALFCV